MSELKARRRAAASGTTGSVVVLLHGYGADSADLMGLADPLAPHMPDTVFIAPDAPEPCAINPMGFQWFPIPRMDGSTEAAAAASAAASAAKLDAFLDGVLEEEGITPGKLVLFGFSQGTMMSLHVGLRRPEALGGIVGFSGRLLVPERLEAEIASKPPVLLLHGDADDVVPPVSLPQAADALVAQGVETYTHVMKGVGHGIAPDGLGLALSFMREKLGIA